MISRSADSPTRLLASDGAGILTTLNGRKASGGAAVAVGAAVGGTVAVGALDGAMVGTLVAAGAIGAAQAASIPIDMIINTW